MEPNLRHYSLFSKQVPAKSVTLQRTRLDMGPHNAGFNRFCPQKQGSGGFYPKVSGHYNHNFSLINQS
jgi:hypothetical protein